MIEDVLGHPSIRDSNIGMTLIEALVSLGLLGIVLVGARGIFQGMDQGTKVSRLQSAMIVLDSALRAALDDGQYDPATKIKMNDPQNANPTDGQGELLELKLKYFDQIVGHARRSTVSTTLFSPVPLYFDYDQMECNPLPMLPCPISVKIYARLITGSPPRYKIAYVVEANSAINVKPLPSPLGSPELFGHGSAPALCGNGANFPSASCLGFEVPTRSFSSSGQITCPPDKMFLIRFNAKDLTQNLCVGGPLKDNPATPANEDDSCPVGTLAKGLKPVLAGIDTVYDGYLNPASSSQLPNRLKLNCVSTRQFSCASGYALQKLIPKFFDRSYNPAGVNGATCIYMGTDTVAPRNVVFAGVSTPICPTHYTLNAGVCRLSVPVEVPASYSDATPGAP